MKGINYLENIDENPKGSNNYDYSNPNSYWESIMIQENKR